jgi:hypothetical protein
LDITPGDRIEEHVIGLLPLSTWTEPLSVPTADGDEPLYVPRDQQRPYEGLRDTILIREFLVFVAPLLGAWLSEVSEETHFEVIVGVQDPTILGPMYTSKRLSDIETPGDVGYTARAES